MTSPNHRKARSSPGCHRKTSPFCANEAAHRRSQDARFSFVKAIRRTRCSMIEHGTLKVSMVSPDGREILLDVRSDGELLGELAAISDGNRQRDGHDTGRNKVAHPRPLGFSGPSRYPTRDRQRGTPRRRRASEDDVRSGTQFGASDSLARSAAASQSSGTTHRHSSYPSPNKSLADWAGLARSSRQSPSSTSHPRLDRNRRPNRDHSRCRCCYATAPGYLDNQT